MIDTSGCGGLKKDIGCEEELPDNMEMNKLYKQNQSATSEQQQLIMRSKSMKKTLKRQLTKGEMQSI